MPDSQERARSVFMDTYRRSLTLVRGEGCYAYTADGRRLLDLVGGIAVNVLGHCHPAVVEAAERQLGRLIHTSNLYYSVPQLELAERLVASAFPSRVFLCNSGAEANEAAIKVARKWGQLNRGGACTIVTLAGAFHGRTLATLAATGNAHYSEPFAPMPEGFRQVQTPDIAAFERALEDPAAPGVAVMVEPVQGESGVHPLPEGFLTQLRQLCDRTHSLLILDEVQTGLGRTGRMWAHQWEGITPDVMTVAKGLAGGLPLGAVLVAPAADVLTPGDHGTTFGGNPVSCAAACAVLDTIENEALVAWAELMGARLSSGLRALGARGLPLTEVRGKGLLIGVGLGSPVAAAVAAASLEEGLLVNPIGDSTIRLAPPLIMGELELELALTGLAGALEAAASQAASV